MKRYITLTPKQLATLRLMLRLQKIRVLRAAMSAFKTGTSTEERALTTIMEREDLINFSDWPLLLAENEAVHNGLPQTVGLDERQHKFLKLTAEFTYSTWQLPGGTQAEQGSMLSLLAEETEGIKLAFSTASPEPLPVGLIQKTPQVKQ